MTLVCFLILSCNVGRREEFRMVLLVTNWGEALRVLRALYWELSSFAQFDFDS